MMWYEINWYDIVYYNMIRCTYCIMGSISELFSGMAVHGCCRFARPLPFRDAPCSWRGDDAHRQAFRSGQSEVSVLSATQIIYYMLQTCYLCGNVRNLRYAKTAFQWGPSESQQEEEDRDKVRGKDRKGKGKGQGQNAGRRFPDSILLLFLWGSSLRWGALRSFPDHSAEHGGGRDGTSWIDTHLPVYTYYGVKYIRSMPGSTGLASSTDWATYRVHNTKGHYKQWSLQGELQYATTATGWTTEREQQAPGLGLDLLHKEDPWTRQTYTQRNNDSRATRCTSTCAQVQA